MMEVYQFHLTDKEVDAINAGATNSRLKDWRGIMEANKEVVQRLAPEYRHVASLPNCNDLEDAYYLMNLWDRPWGVLLYVTNPRSMSVGDLIYWQNQWYVCSMVGFEPINL